MTEPQIIYTNNRHGYAKIKDGKLIISIPKLLRFNKKFRETLIQQGQKLLEKNKKYKHIKTQDQDTVLVFGEEVAKSEFKGDLNKNLKNILLEYVTPIVDEYSQKLGKKYSKIYIRKAKSKWGSCSSDQKLMFNLNLLHLSTKYVRYVIIHEVCHLKHKNHSKKFWAEVEGFLPNYREIRKEMKKMIVE
ncbi:MAG TPA: M48 family metallopeptidase [Candidatus Absconditabacterales bacterium]|nr:M48 family metallopeptidase [Candidatus Absconditabacterales bacterium]